jgi:hypothetical protein
VAWRDRSASIESILPLTALRRWAALRVPIA